MTPSHLDVAYTHKPGISMNKLHRFAGPILVAGFVLVALILVMPLATLAMTSGFIYIALGAVGLGVALYLVWRWIDSIGTK
jgi:hypothetical protein